MQRLAIDKGGLIYWEVDRDKIVSKCELIEILLEDD